MPVQAFPRGRQRTPLQAYRAWLRQGFPEAVAGNLVARAIGLAPTARGWTPGELSALLFLAWRAETGTLPML
jgi:hypothetical protein